MLFRMSLAKSVRCLLLLLFSAVIFESIAEARAGRGRSAGRQQQSRQQQEARPQNPPQQNQSTPARGGGFMRGLAGGLAGGLLGSMLFSSLGFGMNGGGLGGGGIGFLEIILIAAIGYFLFRWWKNRQNGVSRQQLAYQGAAMEPANLGGNDRPFLSSSTSFPVDNAFTPRLSEDEATDIFFRIQAAWMRRDVSAVRDILSDDMRFNLQRDMDELIAQKRSNRLENISVRRVDIKDSWQESGTTLVSVHFVANLLDYVIDDVSGQKIEGDDRQPVKFEEIWIFSQHPGETNWRLAGIEQVS